MTKKSTLAAFSIAASIAEKQREVKISSDHLADQAIIDRLAEEEQARRAKHHGLKKFEIKDEIVHAINKKTALKKYNRSRMPQEYATIQDVLSI